MRHMPTKKMGENGMPRREVDVSSKKEICAIDCETVLTPRCPCGGNQGCLGGVGGVLQISITASMVRMAV